MNRVPYLASTTGIYLNFFILGMVNIIFGSNMDSLTDQLGTTAGGVSTLLSGFGVVSALNDSFKPQLSLISGGIEFADGFCVAKQTIPPYARAIRIIFSTVAVIFLIKSFSSGDLPTSLRILGTRQLPTFLIQDVLLSVCSNNLLHRNLL